MKNRLDQCVAWGVNAPKVGVNAVALLSSAINLLRSDRRTKNCLDGLGKTQRCENVSFNRIYEANPINRSRLLTSTETAPQQCLYEPSSKIVQT